MIEQLRHKLNECAIDAYLVPSQDEFMSEYVAKQYQRLNYLTGFSGSSGLAIITKSHLGFFTDGRYTNQAKKELASSYFIGNLAIKDINDWFEKIGFIGEIGYDPKLHNSAFLEGLKPKLRPVEINLVDQIWQNMPSRSFTKLFNYPLEFAGMKTGDKITLVKSALQAEVDILFITSPENLCWLLNIRASDVEYTPICNCYGALTRSGNVTIFLGDKTKACDINFAEVKQIDEMEEYINNLYDMNIQLDIKHSSIWFEQKLRKVSRKLIIADDPIFKLKAAKNQTEIAGARAAHLQDGIALCEFLYWLEHNNNGLSEYELSEKLLEFRKKRDKFYYPSFPSIIGFKGNGAIIHYQPNKVSSLNVKGDGLLLIDSGGQYLHGTTDVTRTVVIGKATQEQIKNYSHVLKGHIALAMAKFDEDTVGEQLDELARAPLKGIGLDYAHGTGHGVGSFLSVHEGPARIGKSSQVTLSPGMIISNEPGYYKNDEYGIRIENLMLVIGKMGKLQFETLTLCPLEKSLIDTTLLTKNEVGWVNQYHDKVWKLVSPNLQGDNKAWLKEKCKRL